MSTDDRVPKRLQDDYRARINRVIDYIDANLARDLTLDDLAAVANFSKYHFHRLFYSLVGETLFQFIQRVRLEKAAFLLVRDPRTTVTEVALDCGFQDSSSFARSFRNHFGMSATAWRKTNGCRSNLGTMQSNPGQGSRNPGQESITSSVYIEYRDDKSQLWRMTMDSKTQTVEVKELPEMTVAYVRYVGPYQGDGELFERLFSKLFRWAGPRNLVNAQTKTLAVYHDNPEITEEQKLRVSVCLPVPEDTPVDGEIGKMVIAGGTYAMARFELANDEYGEAWNWLYGKWLPASGYVPEDGPCFELYEGEGKDHPEGKCKVSICIPVKPM